MELLEIYFIDIIKCAGVTYLTLAIILLLFKVPKTKYFERYRTSKLYFSSSFVLMSVNIFAWISTFTGDWENPNPYMASIDLLLFYMIGMLLSYGFSNLIDKHYITKKRVATDITKWILSSICAIIGMTEFVHSYIQDTCLIISFAFLLEFYIRYLIYFRKIYLQNSRMLENYFTQDALRFVSWIKRSIVFICISGLGAIVTINEGILINWAFQLYIISISIYIATSFINYSSIYAKLEEAEPLHNNDEIENENTEMSPYAFSAEQNKISLEKRIEVWALTQSYLNNQFTIEELANRLGTNKYYLSRIINEKYHMNFSNWISSLRIEKAKQILKEEQGIKLEDLAYRVGFSSLSYFSKVFSRLEGVSPSSWLKNWERNSEGAQLYSKEN